MKWYKNPILWLCLAIPTATVIGCAFTIYLAISSKEAPVLESYRKQGLSPVKIEQKDTDITAVLQEEALHFRAEPPLQEDLTLYFEHPTQAQQDWQMILQSSTPNVYALPPKVLQALQQERWYVRIQPLDKRWHLQGSTYDRNNRNRLRTQVEFSSR